MPILNFKKRFAPKIRNGSKRQTIRAPRRYPIKPGDTLYLYTGLRSKYAKKLRQVRCAAVHEIVLYFNTRKAKIVIDIQTISVPSSLDRFAVQDGFKDFSDMRDFWIENHPGKSVFKGDLIMW